MGRCCKPEGAWFSWFAGVLFPEESNLHVLVTLNVRYSATDKAYAAHFGVR